MILFGRFRESFADKWEHTMYYPKNYKFNCTVSVPDGYLNGQSLGTISAMKFGRKKVDDNGCGPIAIYNLMQYRGKMMPLPNIIRELEIYAAPLGARGGTSGFLMMIFFLRHHIRFRLRWRIKRLDKADAGILLYYVKRPIFSSGHFIFYRKAEDGRIAIYNRFSNSEEIYYVNSLREVRAQKMICMGFTFK